MTYVRPFLDSHNTYNLVKNGIHRVEKAKPKFTDSREDRHKASKELQEENKSFRTELKLFGIGLLATIGTFITGLKLPGSFQSFIEEYVKKDLSKKELSEKLIQAA